MLRGLVHVLAWSLATGAAVTLSWWGVHTVMTGTAYDPPRALPITSVEATTQGSKPLVSATSRPIHSPTPKASPSRSATAAPAPTPSPVTTRSASPTPSPSATASGEIKTYDTAGGRVVFEFDYAPAYASLVSATPGTGWSMQVWKTDSWIRVEFTSGTDKVSVICTWHDGAPRVEVGNY
jgi:hypothetical protein